MLAAIQQCDLSILLWIQDHIRCPFLTPFFKTITHFADNGIGWIILTVLLLFFASTRKRGLSMVIALLTGIIITNLLLKNLVARIRPYDAYETVKLLISPDPEYSFPSGHSCASFAAATAMFCGKKNRYGVLALILAALIAFSRLYVGIHYPTDVLCGTLIGIGCGIASVRLTALTHKACPGPISG